MGQSDGASRIMSSMDTRAGRAAGDGYEYRCPLCRTTSDPVATMAEARAERQAHRDEFHGGHRPDGEEITRAEPERMRFADLPREQKIATVVVALVLLVGILIKTG